MQRKALYRSFRYHGLTELAQNRLRPLRSLSLAPIDLSIPVTESDILIDAGANVGDITSRFARTGATVYAFEPNPVCFDILSRRFRYLSNVKLFHQGVMDRHCTLTLSSPKAHGRWDHIETTVGSSFVQQTLDGDTTEVACVDLASFILSLPHTKLLKLDIEGAEIPVLRRLIESGAIERVGLTVVETHERFSAQLAQDTEALRATIALAGLEQKVRLDWH